MSDKIKTIRYIDFEATLKSEYLTVLELKDFFEPFDLIINKALKKNPPFDSLLGQLLFKFRYKTKLL